MLTAAITIPYEKAMEFVPNTIKIGDLVKVSEIATSVVGVIATRTVDTPIAVIPNSISPITPIYDLGESSEIKKLAEELQKQFDSDKYILLCQRTRWPVYPIASLNLPKINSDNWFRHEKVVVNRLSINSKDHNEWEVGIDYFFTENDIIHYLSHFGCTEAATKLKSYRHLRSVVDYSDSSQWSIQKRIRDLARQLVSFSLIETEFVSYEVLTEYLKEEKWSFVPNKKVNSVLILPPWNESKDIKDKGREGYDYFIGQIKYDKYFYPDLLTFILTSGHERAQSKPDAKNAVVAASPATIDLLQQAVDALVYIVADIKSDVKGEKYRKNYSTIVGDYMIPLGWHNGVRVSSIKGLGDEAHIIIAPWIQSRWKLDTEQLSENKDYILRSNIWDVVGIKHNGRVSRDDLFNITSTVSALKRKIPIQIEDDIPATVTSLSNKKGKKNIVESADKEVIVAKAVTSVSSKKGKKRNMESTGKPKMNVKPSEARETPGGTASPERSQWTGSVYPPRDTLKIALDELSNKTIKMATKNKIIAEVFLDLLWLHGKCVESGIAVLVPEWTQKKECWDITTKMLNTKGLTADRDYVLLHNLFDFVKRHEGNVFFEDIVGGAEVVTESDGTPDGGSNHAVSIATPVSPMTPAEHLVWLVYKLKNDPTCKNRSKLAAVCELLKPLGWIDGYKKDDHSSVLIPPWLQNTSYYVNGTYTLDVKELIENEDYILRSNVWEVVDKCGGRVDELKRRVFTVTSDNVGADRSKKAKVSINGASELPELQLHHKSPTKALTKAQETDSYFERLTNATSSSPSAYNHSSNEGNSAVFTETSTLREVIELTKSALNGNTSDTLIGRIDERNAIHSHIASSVISRKGLTVYICGSPGVGKTLTVSTVLDSFLYKHQYVVNDPTTKAREQFTVCRVQGTAVDVTSVYSELAHNLGIEADSEVEAKMLVHNRFTGVTASKGKRKNADSSPLMTVLIIDEIDKVSDGTVNELIDCTSAAQSSLVLIGIANTFKYAKDKNITDTIIFSSYDSEKLKNILEMRYQGLAKAETCLLIAKKILKTNSDIRQLLQVGKQVLQEAVSTINDDVLDTTWDKRDIITTKNVVAAFTTLGLGGSLLTQNMLSQVDKFARCLLVSLILDGKTSTNVSEIVPVYNAYAHDKGFGAKSKDEVRELCEQLNQYCLLAGGPKRSSGRRADNDTCTYMVEISAEQALRCETLENIHKESLRKYLNQRNKIEEDFL